MLFSLLCYAAWAGDSALPGDATTPPAALSPAASALSAGMIAVQDKRLDDARAAFERCIAAEPTAEQCAWELGWVHWSQRDWSRVVARWESLATLNAAYPKLDANLAIARDQLKLQRLAAEMRAKAPASFVSTAPVGTTLRLRAVGDMMIGSAFPTGELPLDGGAASFASVASLLADADVTFGNLEGPLCDTDQPSDKCNPNGAPGACYAFRTPRAYAHWYKDAGFDLLSTANNHAFDFGEACRTQTESALDGMGIRWSGRAGTFASWKHGEQRLAMVGFHTADTANNLNDLDTATTIVRGLAADHDIVIVSFHGGAEGSKAIHVPQGPETFYGENRGDLRTFTHAVVDAGADLVLGHGPHVLRAFEGYKGRLIAYSLGNFATYGRFNLSGNQGIGAILEVTMGRSGEFLTGTLHGTVQEGEGIPVPDPSNRAADLVRVLGAEDFARSTMQIAQDGTLKLP